MQNNQTVYCLYVNVTTPYISFKIERGKYLGKMDNKISEKFCHVVEHEDDEVNYLAKEDMFKSEKEACKALIKILQNKVNGK